MRIGAHVSAAGSLTAAIDRAVVIGAEAVQFFATGPQSWRRSSHSPDACAAMRTAADTAGITDLFLHGVYLINLASDDPAAVERGSASLVEYLHVAAATGARGVIFHTGSHKGRGFATVLPDVAAAIRAVLAAAPPGPRLILENSAGQGGTIGGTFAELAAILNAVGDDRIGVCLDTCHAFAAGYDVRTPAGVAAVMDEFARELGWSRLVVVHANDSKMPLGSGKDRHENIGAGHIGLEGFAALMAHPAFQEVPFMLEVPGFAGGGPDVENVNRLKAIREGITVE